jgi:uncharacterized NAD(P)/FAD-binding protein YdhS
MRKTIVVAGGGLSGTLAVMNLLRIALDAESDATAATRIVWIDKEKNFCRGLPYREQPDGGQAAFLLNIPAHMMSPFTDQSDLYTHWLQLNAPHFDQFSFTPRALYGRFLADVLAGLQTQIDARKIDLQITRRVTELSDITPYCDRLSASCKDTEHPIACDAVALCVGHQSVDQFAKFVNTPGYVQSPYQLCDYSNAISATSNESVALLVGGGSSSIDAIRAFETLRFNGRYIVLSSSPVPPWGWDAELYKRRSPDQYQPLYLTPEAAITCTDLDQLMALLNQEVTYALAYGFGYGNVYFGIKPDRLFRDADGAVGYRRTFLNHLFQCRKAMSAPESVNLLERLADSGRVVRLQGTAVADGSAHKHGRFLIKQKERGADAIEADILVNCAQVVRAYQTPINDSLLSKLQAKHLVELSTSGLLEFVPGSGVYPLGPMTSPPEGGPRYLWSARFIREEVCLGINNMLSDIDARHHCRSHIPGLLRSESLMAPAD